MKISLIVPSYNREELLVQTLECALKQDYPDYEILLIDQTKQHAPATATFLDAHRDRIRIIQPETASVTKARNIGLREAKGELLVFTDDDVSYDETFLRRHVAAHAGGIQIVQGRVTEQMSKHPDRPTWLTDSIRFKGGDNCDHDGPTNNITGCNFSMTRDVIGIIGYFDENYRGVSVREESDYALRAYRAGVKFRFSASAGLFHHRSPSGGVGSGVRNLFFEKSYYYCEMMFAKKHFSPWVQFSYRIRLYLRGIKNLRKLIRAAEKEADEVLSAPKRAD